ncbi:uncharacterized protein LOC131258163 isoform X2 [Magnolia sinica]|nr:uncharacterized protein LOC131258163 isoform X2 [Magnolia sinica]
MGGEQQAQPLSWFHDNDGQHMMMSDDPNLLPQRVSFRLKTDTNLFEIAKCKTSMSAIEAQDGADVSGVLTVMTLGMFYAAVAKTTFKGDSQSSLHHFWYLAELDIQGNGIDDLGGSLLSCFPESFTSMETLNFANLFMCMLMLTLIYASEKIADAKLAKDFQAVLKEFQKAQWLAAETETTYAPFVPQAVLPSSYTVSVIDIHSEKTTEEGALLVESRSLIKSN